MAFWKITGKEDSLSLYAEAPTAQGAKEKCDALVGYLKPEHIDVVRIEQKDIPEEETVL